MLSKFLQDLVSSGKMTLEVAETIQAASEVAKEVKKEASGRECCMACGSKSMYDDYICFEHSELKARDERKFWQEVEDHDAGNISALAYRRMMRVKRKNDRWNVVGGTVLGGYKEEKKFWETVKSFDERTDSQPKIMCNCDHCKATESGE